MTISTGQSSDGDNYYADLIQQEKLDGDALRTTIRSAELLFKRAIPVIELHPVISFNRAVSYQIYVDSAMLAAFDAREQGEKA